MFIFINSKFKKTLACTLTTISAIGLVSVQQVAYAKSNEGQTISELRSDINKKISKIELSNDISESTFKRKIKSAIKDDTLYSFEIENFEREKATKKETGNIKFKIVLTDSGGKETTMSINKTIPKVKEPETYVYLKIIELKDKYLKVTDSNTIQNAKDNPEDFDTSKYLITSKELDIDDLVKVGWFSDENSNKNYYLSQNGLAKGWLEINNSLYYFNETNGESSYGWQLIDGKWYYFSDKGSILTGFQKINGKTYYLSPKISTNNTIIADTINLPNRGEMATYWKSINSKWYFFNDTGEMQVGWRQINGKWYYFKENGVMAANTKIDGYELNSNGEWIY